MKKLINKYQNGDNITTYPFGINYSKRGGKLIKRCQNGERVNMSKQVTNSKGIPLKVDNNLLEELDNFLIKQNVGLPQRQAILYTVVQEGSTTGSHGNRAYGYLGWRGSRIPGKGVNQMQYLYDTIFGEFNKDQWNHGGAGSGYMSGREAQQSFINATNVNDALRSLNYGYVRPELEQREFRSKTKYFNEDEEAD